MQIPLIGRKFHNHFDETDCNFYIEVEKRGGEATVALHGTPGLRVFYDSGILGPVRGMFEIPDRGVVYAVIRDRLFEINATSVDADKNSGAAVQRGQLLTEAGPVNIRYNGHELGVSDGEYLYIYNRTTGVFTQLIDPNLPKGGSLDFQDSYFIVHTPETGQFAISAPNDGLTWNGLDYATAEGWPDDIKRVFCDHRELWLFGTQTTEVWYNSGGSPFPFDRISGAFIEYGIGAAASPAKADNSVFWLTDKGLVCRSNNYTPEIVSTRLVEHQISRYSRIDDAIGFSMIFSGHQFYVLHFPTANKTWMLDITMGFWSRWASYPDSGRHRSNCYAWIFRKHLVGDFENGIVYELSDEVFDDNGQEIRGQWTLPPIASERRWLFHDELEVHMLTGVGVETESEETDGPQMALQISDDTGITWGNERWESMGKIGQYDRRVYWKRLGKSRNRLYRIIISGPVKRIILGVYADFKQGTG